MSTEPPATRGAGAPAEIATATLDNRAAASSDTAPEIDDALSPDARGFERIELLVMGDPAGAAERVAALGGTVELASGQRMQALIPTGARRALLTEPGIIEAEPALLTVPLQASAGLQALLGADRWRAAGFTGYGVKVAILDGGFRGYEPRLGRTLPQAVTARSFRAGLDVSAGTDHGTLAAEVLHSIAPGAQLYLVSFGTLTELSAAVDFLAEERVDIVTFSLGFLHSGPGDGSGPVNAIIGRGVDAGALWLVAAGNWARQHWRGPFVDSNGDSIHEFVLELTGNGRRYQNGDLISVSLRWDDQWGGACSDFDLELFAPSGTLVRASRRSQDCVADPVEGFQVLATETGPYVARIIGADVRRQHTLDLLMVGSPDRGDELDFATPASSLSEPADHPRVLSVGALGGPPPLAAAPFSSRGPTTDGRPKPELLSPTGGLPPSASSFAGTSAAAPHVAAVAAMLREALSPLDTAALQGALLARSIELNRGAPGAPEVMASLGSLERLGPLLPGGVSQSRLVGSPPRGGGLALMVYLGPTGFPARFGHLLTPGRAPLAYFRFDEATQTFDRFILGAPGRVQTFSLLESGRPYVVRYAGP